jgi:hypothetical protein
MIYKEEDNFVSYKFCELAEEAVENYLASKNIRNVKVCTIPLKGHGTIEERKKKYVRYLTEKEIKSFNSMIIQRDEIIEKIKKEEEEKKQEEKKKKEEEKRNLEEEKKKEEEEKKKKLEKQKNLSNTIKNLKELNKNNNVIIYNPEKKEETKKEEEKKKDEEKSNWTDFFKFSIQTPIQNQEINEIKVDEKLISKTLNNEEKKMLNEEKQSNWTNLFKFKIPYLYDEDEGTKNEKKILKNEIENEKKILKMENQKNEIIEKSEIKREQIIIQSKTNSIDPDINQFDTIFKTRKIILEKSDVVLFAGKYIFS